MKAKTDFYRVLSIHHDKKSFLNDVQFFLVEISVNHSSVVWMNLLHLHPSIHL